MFTGKLVEQVLRFLPSTFTSTFRRPRCAIPRTTSRVPLLPAWRIISLSIGINASPPSSEKRFAPGILRRGNVQGLQRRSVRLRSVFLFAIESRATRLDTLLDPAFFFGAGDVHILGTNRAAVGLLEGFQQLAEFHGFFAAGK